MSCEVGHTSASSSFSPFPVFDDDVLLGKITCPGKKKFHLGRTLLARQKRLYIWNWPSGGNQTCADGYTCCMSPTGSYACCPLQEAVCCSDQIHCCPKGSTCDTKGGRCSKRLQVTFSVYMTLLYLIIVLLYYWLYIRRRRFGGTTSSAQVASFNARDCLPVALFRVANTVAVRRWM